MLVSRETRSICGWITALPNRELLDFNCYVRSQWSLNIKPCFELNGRIVCILVMSQLSPQL